MACRFGSLWRCTLLLSLCSIQVAASEPDVVILFCDWQPANVHYMSLAKAEIRTMATTSGIKRPVAIDYDQTDSTVYWTDVSLKQIRATSLIGTGDRILLSLNSSSTPDGLAVDIVARKVFYTDTGNDVIGVIDMNGTNHQQLITNELLEPKAIVLDQEKRKLYYTDWGSTPYISVANYDGTGMNKIYTTGLIWPNGLTLDKKNDVLYWCDAKTHKIERGSITGNERRVLLNEPLAHYFDIFLHADTLYFTDWRRKAILTLPKGGGNMGVMSESRIGQPAGIHVYSTINPARCQDGQYGQSCTTCGHCLTNSACEKITGHCLAGCNPGYQGFKCVAPCISGKYGKKCPSTCGNCLGGTCDHVTGRCAHGCIAGWQPPLCQSECPFKTYGSSCTACGQCALDSPCDKRNGYCPNGCKTGWKGLKCDSACMTQTYGPSCIPCGYCKDAESCDQTTGQCPRGCQEGWTGALCKTRTACKIHTYGPSCISCGYCKEGVSCDKTTGQCPRGCQEGWTGALCKTHKDTDDVPIGFIIGTIFMLGLIGVSLFLIRRKKRELNQAREASVYASMQNPQCHIYSVDPDVRLLSYASIADISREGTPRMSHSPDYATLSAIQSGMSSEPDYLTATSKIGGST